MNDIQNACAGAGEVDEEQEARLAAEALESLAAEKRLAELVSPEAIDRMLGDAEAAGIAIDGPDGLLGQMTKVVLERALGAEMDGHLGYVKGDPAGAGSGEFPQRALPQDGHDHGGPGADRRAARPQCHLLPGHRAKKAAADRAGR